MEQDWKDFATACKPEMSSKKSRDTDSKPFQTLTQKAFQSCMEQVEENDFSGIHN